MASAEPEESSALDIRLSQNNGSSQSLLSRGGSGYESTYGSFFGSRFSFTDGSGIYVSSLALTIILSILVVVGIVLVAVIITLSVMLSACEQKHHSSLSISATRADSHCLSYQLNLELNNLQGQQVPSGCLGPFSRYIYGGQYLNDVEAVVDSARTFLKTFVVEKNKNYTVILDIDETILSNFLNPRNRLENFVDLTSPHERDDTTSPLVPVLSLYSDLIATNWKVVFLSERSDSGWDATARNLVAAGYESWTLMILRSNDEADRSVQEFKARKRVELEKQGYQIKAVVGDQWSDISGLATGARAFKLPNPVYQIL